MLNVTNTRWLKNIQKVYEVVVQTTKDIFCKKKKKGEFLPTYRIKNNVAQAEHGFSFKTEYVVTIFWTDLFALENVMM